VQLGDVAIKYSLHPHESSAAGTVGDRHGDDYLREDIVSRLAKGPVKWRLCLQLFVDEERTLYPAGGGGARAVQLKRLATTIPP
jgi:catalase